MKKTYPIVDTVKTGQNLKRIMKERGFTVRDIQEFLELGSPQGIYHWFQGRSMPTLDHLYALSELFGMSVDALLIGNRKYEYMPFAGAQYNRVYLYYEKVRKDAV